MNRRSFLSGLGALVGGIAIEKAIPFNRVWSFPKDIKCVNAGALSGTIEEIEATLEFLWANYSVGPTHFISPFDADICRQYELPYDVYRSGDDVVCAYTDGDKVFTGDFSVPNSVTFSRVNNA